MAATPTFWNPLSLAAAWLSTATGRPMDARGLVDMVAQSGRMGTPEQTVIKALMPKSARFALLGMPGHPELDEFLASDCHAELSGEFGRLPTGLAYIQEVRIDVIPLCVNQLLDLLMRGEANVAIEQTGRADEMVWMMPINGGGHTATIETCGINRENLLALRDALVQQPEPVTETTKGTPSMRSEVTQVETQEQRRARRYQMCIAAGIELPSNDYAALPRGVGAVAKREGIKRQSFCEDVKAHIRYLNRS